jgi:hypothetical protein
MKQPHSVWLEKSLSTSVHGLVPYRGNWRVATEKGEWVAKRVKDSAHLRWWTLVDRELRLRGFQAMPTFRSDGREWAFTRFLEARAGNYADRDETAKMMGTLAAFHLRGKNLTTPPKKGAPFLLYHRLHERLTDFYKVLNVSHAVSGELGKLLRVAGPAFYRDGFEAWLCLGRLPLARWCHEGVLSRCLAHRDLASHNWLVDVDGQMWLIDFDTADYDAQIGDVWQMASRMLSETGWEEGGIERLLSAYEEVRPLTAIEKRILASLLAFPNEFYREAIGLVKRKPGYKLEHSLPYLQKITEYGETWRRQIRALGYW